MTAMDVKTYLGWLEVRLSAAQATSPDALLVVNVVEVLLLAILFVAWRRALWRARALAYANAGLSVDLAAVRTTLENWRQSEHVPHSKAVGIPSNADLKSPRELLELLARESLDFLPATTKTPITQEDSLVACFEHDQRNTSTHNS